MHATTLCARALAQPPDTGVRFFQLGLSILCCCRPNHLKIKISVSIFLATRDGHAPIFADAHRCASDAHNSHKTHQIVKKNQLFLTKILWFWTLIFHSWGWIKPSGMNNNDILGTHRARLTHFWPTELPFLANIYMWMMWMRFFIRIRIFCICA